MLETCMCSKPGCKVCDPCTYPVKPKPVEARARDIPEEMFVDFNKLLETDDKQQLVDILKKDIRDKKQWNSIGLV